MFNPNSWNQSITLTSQDEDAEALVTSGAYEAGTIPINGTQAVNDEYKTQTPAFILLTCADDERDTLFTIVGVDASQTKYTYNFFGVNAGTLLIDIPFQYIAEDGISCATDTVGDISFGVSDQTATPWMECDINRLYWNVGMDVVLSSDANLIYSIEGTNENAISRKPSYAFPDQTLANQTINGTTAINIVTAFERLRFNSWTQGAATVHLVQAGGAIGTIPRNRTKTLGA